MSRIAAWRWNSQARAHAFHFAFRNVAPGTHTVKIQYRSQAGAEVYIDTRSLFVHYQ